MPTSVNPPEAAPPTQQDPEVYLTAAQSFRLLGMLLRLYPVQNSVVQEALAKTTDDFHRYFQANAILTLSLRQHALFVNETKANKRQLSIGLQDLAEWMESASLEIIKIASTVTEEELIAFLTALVTFDSEAPQASAHTPLAELNLSTIRYGALAATNNVPELAGDRTWDVESTLSAMHDEPQSAVWQQVRIGYENTSRTERKTLLQPLAEWLKHESQDASPALVDEIDHWLTSKVKIEEEASVFGQLLSLIESRYTQLLQTESVDEAGVFLEAVRSRAQRLKTPQDQHIIEAFLNRISATNSETSESSTPSQQLDDQIRQVREILGEQQIQALLAKLKNDSSQEDRMQAITNIQQLGLGGQAIILRELNAENPWFVYRNLLNVLAKIGDEQAMIPIAEKITHEDHRVRIAAITTIAQIGREKALPYLLQAFQDASPEVRAAAAAQAALCPQPPILEALLDCLTVRFPWKAQPDTVRIMACIALGQFDDQRAWRALLPIVTPPQLALHRDGEMVRCSAINALEKYAAQPEVQRTLRHAANDASLLVRQTAMQVLARSGASGTT